MFFLKVGESLLNVLLIAPVADFLEEGAGIVEVGAGLIVVAG